MSFFGPAPPPSPQIVVAFSRVASYGHHKNIRNSPPNKTKPRKLACRYTLNPDVEPLIQTRCELASPRYHRRRRPHAASPGEVALKRPIPRLNINRHICAHTHTCTICTYIYADTDTYIEHICQHIYLHMCIYIYMYVCMSTDRYVYIYRYMNIRGQFSKLWSLFGYPTRAF